MRYITSIENPEGRERSLEWVDGSIAESYLGSSIFSWLSHHATMSEGEFCSAFIDIEDVGDILGVGKDTSLMQWIATAHTKKTAMLHKYVDWVKWEHHGSYAVADADMLYYPEGVVAFYGEPGENDTLVVRMTQQRLAFCGLKGSVVHFDESIYNSEKSHVWTLYDFLIYVSRLCQCNIMRYHFIQFECERLQWYCQLQLTDSVEANRFFTKMWFEACRKVERP